MGLGQSSAFPVTELHCPLATPTCPRKETHSLGSRCEWDLLELGRRIGLYAIHYFIEWSAVKRWKNVEPVLRSLGFQSCLLVSLAV